MMSMINAYVLMTLGIWGYFATEIPSPTTLIPVFAGSLLLSFIRGLMYGSKSMAELSFVLTLLIPLTLIKPLNDAITLNDFNSVYRIGIMMVTCSITSGFFVIGFIRIWIRRSKIKS